MVGSGNGTETRMTGIYPNYKDFSQNPVSTVPKIPEKLDFSGFRVIKIRPKSKLPHERNWQNTRNFSSTDSQIQDWLHHYHSFEVGETHYEGYGNYGVLCSSTAIVIDLDSQEILDALFPVEPRKEGVKPLPTLPATYTVQSGSKRGIHLYYRTSGARPVRLLDPQDPDKNVGDIQSTGKFVVGESSIHPSGRPYEVIMDLPIATVEFDSLLKIFSQYIKKEKTYEKPVTTKMASSMGGINVPIERIMYPLHAEKRGDDEVQGEHPVHGSTGKRNLSVNIRKGTWYCHRCQSGGGPAEAIAVVHGLINCSDARSGCLRGDLFKTVVEIAESDYGWTQPIKRAPESPKILKPKPPSAEEQFDFGDVPKPTPGLPDVLPDATFILVNALPRIGKSHWAELQAIKHKTANVIANTHSVIEHHLRIFGEHRIARQTAVHLEGKNRCCNRRNEGGIPSCKKCYLYPYSEDPGDRGRFISRVMDFLFEEEIVTSENVPEDTCTYFFLKEAAKVSNYVYTVTENLEEITGDEYQPRHLTIIDEDTCFSNFFPQSADLCEFTRLSTKHYIHNTLESKWKGIQRWKDYLTKKGKRPKGKATILRMIEILEQIREILEITDRSVFNPAEIITRLNALDVSIPDPEDITKPELIRAIKRWELSNTFSYFVDALLYPYEEKRFMWQGYNNMKLRMVANEETRIYDPPNTKTILIGSTRAELFLRTLQAENKIDVITLNEFPYSNYFLFVIIKNDREDKDPKASKKHMKNEILVALEKIRKTNSISRYPLLVLTGTKKEQGIILEEFGGISKGSTDENEVGQNWNYLAGYINVFYQNSVMSRGIDVPYYKSMFMVSSDFASPYWTAKLEVALNKRKREDAVYAEAVRDAITIDETTNSILRITPTLNTQDNVPRLVIVNERDMWKIKPAVLKGATVVEVTTGQLTKNLEEALSIVGRMEMMPSRHGDVDEYGHMTSHNYTDVHFEEPETLIGKPVKAKCEYIADLLTTEVTVESWRKKVSPHIVASAEKEVIEYLLFANKDNLSKATKKKTRGVLQRLIVKRHKRLSMVLAGDILSSMQRRNLIRIVGIGLAAGVSLPSATVADKEKEEKRGSTQ